MALYTPGLHAKCFAEVYLSVSIASNLKVMIYMYLATGMYFTLYTVFVIHMFGMDHNFSTNHTVLINLYFDRNAMHE